MSHVIAVTGGIGSGKSIVCNILSCLGYPVYDSDIRAKSIVDNDTRLKRQIAYEICQDVLDSDLNLNRRLLGEIVFNDSRKLDTLNRIVHGAVKLDLIQWISKNAPKPLVFIETAILYQSHIDSIVNEVWEVSAPEELKITRVCLRNGLSEEEVKARIKSQFYQVDNPHPNTHIILNDNRSSILLQISELISNVAV